MTLAKLYLEAARVAKMIEGTNLRLGDCFKLDGEPFKSYNIIFNSSPDRYEACLAIVEGKPVFKGDVLYYNSGVKIIADIKAEEFGDDLVYDNLTWSPPKPKTVMVELLVEDAQYIIDSKWYHSEHEQKIKEACLKALGEVK
jgi:hypothetical protein